MDRLREAARYLTQLLGRTHEDDEHLLEYILIVLLIVIVSALSLVFLGDAIADLISLIGGQVEAGLDG